MSEEDLADRVYRHIKKHPGVTVYGVAKALGVAEGTVGTALLTEDLGPLLYEDDGGGLHVVPEELRTPSRPTA